MKRERAALGKPFIALAGAYQNRTLLIALGHDTDTTTI